MSLTMQNFDEIKILEAIDLIVCNSKRMALYSNTSSVNFTSVAVQFINEQNKAISAMATTMKIFLDSIEQINEVNDQLNHIINLNKIMNDAGVKPG